MGRISPYHTNSPEVHPVYHNREDCPDGGAIEGDHYAGGRGEGRSLCAVCRRLGSGRYGAYEGWIERSLATASERSSQAVADAGRRQDELDARQAEHERLVAGRNKLAAERKPLEAKGKNRTPAEEARFQQIRRDNTRLYNEQLANQTLMNQVKKEQKDHEKDAAKAQQDVTARETLQTAVLTALDSVADGCEPEDACLLADVVMNEARAESKAAKRAVAYAYINLKRGKVAPPQGAEISHFRPAEDRFAELQNEPSRLAYVGQVKDSLDVVVSRLHETDVAGTDPTGGATNWVSPKNLLEELKDDYAALSGTFSYLKDMEAVVVPGVPAETFTFYRPRKKPRAAARRSARQAPRRAAGPPRAGVPAP
jgi:hypothetical protein